MSAVEWFRASWDVVSTVLFLGLSVFQLMLMWTMLRVFTRWMGMTQRPLVTRQIGGKDVRPSKRGTDLPKFRWVVRRLWCRRHVATIVKTLEGREKRCAYCGKDLEDGEPETWV